MKTTARVALLVLVALGLDLRGPAARAETLLFLVAESTYPFGIHRDSYVLPLENPAAIQHARDLIAFGPGVAGAPIVVAHIAAGADGINRDLLAPGDPEWSWHVTQFEGFADFTIEILDGWPGYVEQDVDGWIANTGGRIGFWSYTVVQEVPEPGRALSALAGFGFLGWLAWRRRARGAVSSSAARAGCFRAS